jgi:predicted MFS family arabinose efflux permease
MSQSIPTAAPRSITPMLAFMLALSCGLIVANFYYAQPLTGLIGEALGSAPAQTGLIATLTQSGYALGLLLFVPLGDLVENRTLAVASIAAALAALVAMSTARFADMFLAATLLLGVACSSVQILLPYAAHFTTEANRGRVIGGLTSGLMLGIMLARPAASFVTFYAGWRAVFALSAALMGVVAAILAAGMPRYRPSTRLSYLGILRSMPPLLRDVPILRRRAAYHAALYASFSLFWTAVPLLLASAPFGFSQQAIGLFALAGTGGVIVAPVAGRIADRGWTTPATGLAIACVLVAFVIALVGGELHSVALLVVAALLIDAGLVTNFVLSQRLIYGPKPESRSRIGALFTAMFFAGGALGSALAAASLVAGGWQLTSAIGMGFAACALLLYAGELIRSRTSRAFKPRAIAQRRSAPRAAPR